MPTNEGYTPGPWRPGGNMLDAQLLIRIEHDKLQALRAQYGRALAGMVREFLDSLTQAGEDPPREEACPTSRS